MLMCSFKTDLSYFTSGFSFLQESIDFGLLPSNGPPATIKLLLLNSGNKPIPVQNVIATPVTEAMQIDFSPTKIPPDTMKPTVVAQVTFDRKWKWNKKSVFLDAIWLSHVRDPHSLPRQACLLLPLSCNWVAD